MAPIPVATAALTNPSGCEAPSRKLKALAACSSIYSAHLSVIQCLKLPLLAQKIVREQAKQHLLRIGHGTYIPLFVRPHLRRPPLAALTPGTIGLLYGIAFSMKHEGSKTLAFMLNHEDQWRAIATQSDSVFRGSNFFRCRVWNNKALHHEAVRTVCIQQSCSAYTFFANEFCNASKRYIQTQRLRQLRCKKAKLHLAAVSRLGVHEDTHHACGWWVYLKIEVQQLQKHFTLQNRKGRFDGAFVLAASLQTKLYGDAGKCEAVVLRSGEKLVDHGAKDKKQRVENLYRRVEREEFFQRQDRFFRHHKVRRLTAREQPQTLALLSQTNHNLHLRQAGEFTECM